MSTYVSVVISPATTTSPVVISVSQATRPVGSSASTASSTESEIWSATLSGCPSVTDSDVKRNSRTKRVRLLDLEKRVEGSRVARAGRPLEERAQGAQVLGHVRRQVRAAQRCEAFDQRDRVLQVDVEEAAVRGRHPRGACRLLEVCAVRQALARRAHALDSAGRARQHELRADRAVVEPELLAERDRLLSAARHGCSAARGQLQHELVERREAG